MTVTPGLAQTPLLAGTDPFEQFPGAGETSAGTPTTARLGREPGPPPSLLAAVAAVTAALAPTTSSQPPVALVMRRLVERFQVTRANLQDVLPLLGFSPPAQQAAGPAALKAVPRGNAARALAAAADLSSWLGMTEEQIADIAGFSRRNYSNWRSGIGSYPKTVRGLFEIHALVGGLVRALGPGGALSWMGLASATGDPRQQLLATAAGRAQLTAEAQALLFARAEREQFTAEFGEERIDAVPEGQHAAAAVTRTPPRRRRRPG